MRNMWCARPLRSFLFSFIHDSLLCADVFLLSALLLAARLALLPCAPVEDNRAGDPSGEEEEVESAPDKLKDALESVLGITKAHRKEVSV